MPAQPYVPTKYFIANPHFYRYIFVRIQSFCFYIDTFSLEIETGLIEFLFMIKIEGKFHC